MGRQKRWTQEEENELIELYNDAGLTYKQIGEKLGRSKDSVGHRIGELIKNGKLEYRSPNKIKNRYEYDLSNLRSLNPLSTYFVISILCDGHVRKRKVQFDSRERDVFDFRKIYGHILKMNDLPHIIWRKKLSKKRGYYIVGKFWIHSKPLVDLLLKKYNVPLFKKSGIIKIPNEILECDDPKIHGAVMRAVYECEGSVNLHDKSLCVTIANTSILFLQELSEILDSYNIDNNIYDIRLRISALDSLLKFYEMAYCTFDFNLYVAAKKTGLGALIERKSKRLYKRRNRR